MRALGLPNTKHFHEITRIEDALACASALRQWHRRILRWLKQLVAEKLKQEGRHEIFEQETMEELEDDDGNVYNRKTYDDLKKQGLIWFQHKNILGLVVAGVSSICTYIWIISLSSSWFSLIVQYRWPSWWRWCWPPRGCLDWCDRRLQSKCMRIKFFIRRRRRRRNRRYAGRIERIVSSIQV